MACHGSTYLIFNTHNSVNMLILQNTALSYMSIISMSVRCRRDISTFLYYLMVWTKCKISIFWKHLVQADQHIFLLFLLHSKIKPSIRVLYCFCFVSYVCQGKGSPAVPILQLSLTSGGGWVKYSWWWVGPVELVRYGIPLMMIWL